MLQKSSDTSFWPMTSASPVLEMPLLAAVMECSPDPWWIVGLDLSLTHFNSAFGRLARQLTNVEPRHGMTLDQLFAVPRHQALNDRWRDLYGRILAGRTVSSDEWYPGPTGGRCLTISGTPVLIGGRITGAALHARDMPQKHEVRDDALELALTRLFASEAPLDESLEAALRFLCEADGWDAAIAWLVDPTEAFLNAQVIYTGATVNQHDFHRRLTDLKFPKGRGLPGRCWAGEELISIADLMEETGMARATIAALIGLHGVVAVPLADAGRVIGVVELLTGPVRPLTEHHKASLRRTGASLAHLIARRRSEIEKGDLLETIRRKGTEWAITFDSIEIPIFLTSPEGAILRVNRAGRDVAGRSYRELMGMPLGVVREGEPWRTLGDAVTAVRESSTTCSARAHDPVTDRTWDISASLSRVAAPGEEQLIVVLREITALVRLQDSVARGEQLAALGELVAGVAHQVRNPIFGISALLDGLEQRTSDADADTREIVTGIRRWLERLSTLMEELLQYGRSWRLDLSPGELGPVVKQAADVIRPQAEAADVRVEVEAIDGIEILMDAGRLVQAVENLITNAVQHSPAGGTVLVTLCRAWEREDRVELTVRDHGPGFPAADLRRLFQPFFTRRRGGAGLGLSIVQRIIEEHGGTVIPSNDPAGGAVMTAVFPIYEAAMATPGADA